MRKEHLIVSIFIVTIIPSGARRKARFVISSGANACTARDFHEDPKASVIVSIKGFHSRGQHLCKFIGTKEIVYIRKEFSTPTGLVWYTNMAAISLFWNTNTTVMSNRCVNLSSLVGVCLDVIALSVSRQPIGLLCEECRLALAPVLGGHLAAARKRSHQWCLTLTPNNTETVERMTCHCFLRPSRRHLTSSSYACGFRSRKEVFAKSTFKRKWKRFGLLALRYERISW